jgi:hypothetical protein
LLQGSARLTLEFFADRLPEKKLQLSGISMLLILLSRRGCYRRVIKEVMNPTTIKRSLVNSRRANTTTKTRRTEPKVKENGKAKLLHAINVVVQITLLRNVEPRNTWLDCTKDP